MISTATTTWGYQATAGAVARRDRWSAADAALGSFHHAAAIKPMSFVTVVKTDPNGIRHRPPEDSN